MSSHNDVQSTKSTPHTDAIYEQVLIQEASSHMSDSVSGISETSEAICQLLLSPEQVPPEGTMFDRAIFRRTCDMLRHRNEAKIVQDIGRLIVPSAETLSILETLKLRVLTESVDEGWNSSIPVTKIRPPPDYAVGYLSLRSRYS